MKVLFQPIRRVTLHIPATGPVHDQSRGHLFVILTDTCPNGLNLLVPICTVRRNPDRTCLLDGADHSFLCTQSFVMYDGLDFYESDVLKRKVTAGIVSYEGIIEERVFALISAGIETSNHCAPKFRKYYREQTAKPSMLRAAD